MQSGIKSQWSLMTVVAAFVLVYSKITCHRGVSALGRLSRGYSTDSKIRLLIYHGL